MRGALGTASAPSNGDRSRPAQPPRASRRSSDGGRRPAREPSRLIRPRHATTLRPCPPTRLLLLGGLGCRGSALLVLLRLLGFFLPRVVALGHVVLRLRGPRAYSRAAPAY